MKATEAPSFRRSSGLPERKFRCGRGDVEEIAVEVDEETGWGDRDCEGAGDGAEQGNARCEENRDGKRRRQ